MRRQRSTGLPAQDPALPPVDEEKPAVRQPVDAERQRLHVKHTLHVTGGRHTEDLAGPPVAEPQLVAISADGFAEAKPLHQGAHVAPPWGAW